MFELQNIFWGVLSAVLQLFYFSRLTGRRVSMHYYLLFVLLTNVLFYALQLGKFPFSGLFLSALLLFLIGISCCKVSFGSAILVAVLVVEIMQLCFGTVNSLVGILSPVLYRWIQSPLVMGTFVMIAGNFISFGLTFFCYQVLVKYCAIKNIRQNQSVFFILIPLLMLLSISYYFVYSVYGNTVTINEFGELLGTNHVQMFIIQAFCVVSLFCVMYAYGKLTEGFLLNKKLALLEQETSYQRKYVAEAKFRYGKTQAFRHDIKNHLTIVKGLLDKQETLQAAEYLERLEGITTQLSFPCHTSNPVLDILLENKLSIAKASDIDVQCSFRMPASCLVDDLDLCTMLSNALDNAIYACRQTKEEARKYIHLSTRLQGGFFLIKIENGCSAASADKTSTGIGLSNIRAAAARYQGAVNIERDHTRFCLTILLNISQPPDDISPQTH